MASYIYYCCIVLPSILFTIGSIEGKLISQQQAQHYTHNISEDWISKNVVSLPLLTRALY